MPLSRVPRPPDLTRVRAVLGATPRNEQPDGDSSGVASGVAAVVPAIVPDPDAASSDRGWVPDAPALSLAAQRGRSDHRSRVRKRVVADLEDVEDPGGREGGEAIAGGEGDLGGDLGLLDAQLRRARRPGLLTMPEELRAGRIHVSSAAIVAMLALIVAVGCAFLLRILWAERAAQAPPVAPGVVSTRGADRPSAAAPPGGVTITTGTESTDAGAGAVAASQLVVHVVGQVLRPGLVRLKGGARVADAIEAAGGATKAADLSGLNLARPVVDGEQVVVPKPGEVPVPVGGLGAGPGGAGGAVGGSGGSAGAGGAAGLVNLNTAGLAEFDTLPGVGPVLAQRILDWRTEHGRFSSVDELREVSGIGDTLLGRLRTKVTV